MRILNSTLLVNWLFQRIFRINSEANFSVSFTSKLTGVNRIKFVGDMSTAKTSFAVSGGCYYTIFPNTELEIGENTIWAPNVCISTGNHDLMNRKKYITQSVKIGKNCWIGTSSTILAGVVLGNNVTVGANSVVTKSFPSNCVIGGCPAKILKNIE